MMRYLAGIMGALAVAGGLLAGAPAHAQEAIGPACDNHHFLAVQQAFESGSLRGDRPVHVCGRVLAVSRPKRTRSGWHGYFYVDVGAGVSIRIVSDLDRMAAPRWPWVAKGDTADVVGRYYYDNPRSQGIDWTHHGTGRNWGMEGYVAVNGSRYQ
ncbi:DUF3465 domain-containing protein [Gluconacetobacter azotocaptans]|uniref:DUF3465 domain-containing protein n=2 Tax=Gluconacetobacter azotocaptans TaxID=142834 RepID=A0A7W4PEZ8_9PROT|nr:DUF3465 domain-containing protein [Gluconacetobacter azotocaptans]MBB2190049.1 DUF3465 domain-containing protein [Gluconacetobacter azotocaptans]MBM9402827.1 DUF3465 domain-containing protein [Gluconacetobacter azotocaptans]